MQKNKVKLSKKIIGLGVTAAMALCQHSVSAQHQPKRIIFQIPKLSQPVRRDQLEEIAAASSATIISSNGTKNTINVKNDDLPDLCSQMVMAQKYCDNLICSGVPKDQAIRQMQIAVLSGKFDGCSIFEDKNKK